MHRGNTSPSNRKGTFLRLVDGIGRCFYRIKTHGADKLPAGGFLLLPNHVTWVDAIVLQMACPRRIRFIMDADIYKQPLLNPIFRLLGVIPISPRKAKDAVRTAVEHIERGEIVCIFPEGELTRSGSLLRLRRGFELIARGAGAPVVPVWFDQLWGSIFSFYGGKFFKKIPRKIPYPVTVAFGEPLPPEQAEIALVRQRLLDLGEFCYEQRPILRGHLGLACLRGLKHRQLDTAVIDGMDGSRLTHGMLLAAGLALAGHLRANCPNKRIAIVLPPGRGAIVANLAVVLAGKVPVNLNFTAGRSSIEAAVRMAEVEHVVTASAFEKKLKDFPWPKNVLHIEKILPRLKKKIALWRTLVLLAPWRLLRLLARVPAEGDREEAVLLFTSGTAGEPKGVVLSHHNILANVSQFSLMLSLHREDAVLAALPFFHSFGCTVTLFYPMIEGIRAITYPNPLEIGKTAELIHKHRVTLFVATPTFLRGYLRKAEPEQLESLKLIVTGAEKLPRDVADAFEEKFGKKVLEGYGLTETAPVASVNLPEPKPTRPGEPVQPSSRAGSVGKLAPGIAAHIRDPDTGELLSLHDSGMLWLRGPNIFEGYLGDPKRTAEVIQDGWFKTGDLARFDEDGFLYIEGRISRFSKIGGEMVPHETLETKICQAMEFASEHERVIAVVGVPDEAKGEALVLLSARDIELADLRRKLSDAGIANLWIPKKIRRVDAIPVLGTGKLDLKRCKEMAMAE
jgi:acyl-[acyl-carrier-protein]-phospholipid O-acyltransferase / long-chain-fatty-acid--[acyl-carrier-protein] ligase